MVGSIDSSSLLSNFLCYFIPFSNTLSMPGFCKRSTNCTQAQVEKGLGADTGININSTEKEINAVAANIREIILSL